LGLAYIAAVLEQASHTVQMIDIDADNISKEDFIKILSDNRPDLVGITATTPTVTKAIEISKDIKNNSSAYTMNGDKTSQFHTKLL